MAALLYFFSLLMIPISILIAGASLIAFMATWTSPLSSSLVTYMGLALPVILFVNLIIILYWAFRKSWWIFIPVSAILLNTGYLLSIFQFSPTTPEIPQEATTIRIATYNVGKFKSWPIQRATQWNICNYFQEEQADIVCFQEYYDNSKLDADSLSHLLNLPYHAVEYLSPHMNLGSAIYSKYPIVNQGRLPFESAGNDAMWADLFVHGQTIRIISCHLQTTNFSRRRKELNDPALHQADAQQVSHLFANILEELKDNSVIRAQQAELVRQLIDTTSTPVIVCGDFNDTPSSYTYHRIKGDLKDSFRSRGNGYAYTFRGIHKLLRIDFILYSDNFKCIDYESPNLEWSDHNPVMSEFTFAIQ